MADALDHYFISDESRIQGKIEKIMRARGRVSALMKKETLPDGIGFNFSTVIVKRSNGVGGGWQAVATPDGSGNNCVPTATVVSPAMNRLSYAAYQTRLDSADICFQDLRAAYDAKDQLAAIYDNFQGNIVDTWENQDKALFFQNAGHKIVFNSSLTESDGPTMPTTVATSTINQGLLDVLYNRIIQDGGDMEAYAKSQGAPIIPAILSMEAHRTIVKGDDSIRNDFRWADSGKGVAGATLLQSWGIDRTWGGFMHVIDVKMPRFDFVDGAWVERPFYISESTFIGSEAIVNPAYEAAEFEDLYLWNPDVVTRQVPKMPTSFGSGSSAKALNLNGAVQWLNIPDKVQNPYSNIGFYSALLYAAYKPKKTQYGVVVRFRRCPHVATTDCPAY
jgi:hypothetical protein